jgi:hypothetical protein
MRKADSSVRSGRPLNRNDKRGTLFAPGVRLIGMTKEVLCSLLASAQSE